MDRLPRRRRIYDQFNEDDEQYAGNYPLSKQILDYYYKFGQERNLERYLKLNRSLGSKSSSDGSLDRHSARRRHVSFRQERCKSLEHLERGQREEKLVQTECTSYQSCVDQVGEEQEQQPEGYAMTESSSSELVVAGDAQDMKQLRKVTVRKDQATKSYQINVESKVEIAFPTQFYQAMTAGMVFPAAVVPVEKPETEKVIVTNPDPEIIEEKEEGEITTTPIPFDDPIPPPPAMILDKPEPTLLHSPKNQSTVSENQNISPTSSIASTNCKQRLEWDSLGDVGYQQRSQSEPRVGQPSFKSTSVKETKSVSEPPTLTSSKSTGAIPKRKLEIIPPPVEKKEIRSASGDKWKLMARKGKEKSSILLQESSKLETPSSKILFDTNSSKFAQSTPVVSPVVEVAKKEEKSSQTSDIGTVSRSIQAIFEHFDKTTSISSNHESTAGSFEYVKGSQVDRGCSAISQTSTSSPSVVVDEQSKRMNTIRVRKEISSFLANVTGKDPQAEDDIQKAVEYIALLFDTKSIDKKFKRKLVEKIISKLLRGKERISPAESKKKESPRVESTEITSEISSTSIKSRNSTKSNNSKISDINKQSELLKNWLKPMTNSEIEYERKMKEKEENPPLEDEPLHSQDSEASLGSKEKEKNLQLRCIEREIEYLERIKKLIEVGRMNLIDPPTHQNVREMRRPLTSESRTTAESSLSITSSRHSSVSLHSKKTSATDWDSHKNLQIVIRERRKLNTPPEHQPAVSSDARFGDLKEFVDRKTKEFAERYEKRASLYTNPSKHYSEPRSDSDRGGGGDQRRHQRVTLVNAATSVNSCEFSCTGPEFAKTESTIESSASRLAATNSKSKQKVTHEVSQQTATSMSFSAPIASSRTQPSRTVTSRRGGLQTARTQGTTTESIAYTIVLNPNPTSPISTGEELATNASVGDLLYDQVSGGGGNTERIKICSTGRFRLEDYLKLNRPDFIEHAEERKEEVETTRKRRVLKNHEKENLLMSPHLARSRISKLLEASLKDPETKKISSNSSFIYKQQARRKYKRLPEVKQREEAQKQNAYKKNTKIVAEVFNRNLQRITLRGETNIPHSRRVLTTL